MDNNSIQIKIHSGRVQTLHTPVCPACGRAARRVEARFCATCGRQLDSSGYLPADSVRASYHLQQRRPALGTHSSASVRIHYSAHRTLFTKHYNSAAATALAFVTYALVPYLGILFCPGAIVMGSIGLLRAHRTSCRGGRRAASFSIVMGLLILGAQIFLWWILYQVPQWARP